MIDPTVRRADGSDVAQLERLEAEARGALVGKRGGDRWLADNASRAGEWISTLGEALVFVAVIDDVIVGYVVGRVDGGVGTVEEIYVHPEARDCGFGSELLNAALKGFTEAGADVVDGSALPGDRETKNLYERAGITARLITLSARIGEPKTS